MNGLATASFFAFGALLVLFGANASDIIRELDLDYGNFGLVASMLSMGIGCGILCAGPAVDRLPRRPLFAISCGGVALTNFSLGPETGFTVLLVASFLIGFGAGFYETLLNTVIVEQAREQAPRRLLFIHSAATLGASVTPFAIGLLREPLALDWYDSFRAAGALHLILLFGLPLLPTGPEGHALPTKETSESSPDRAGRFLLMAICATTFIYVGVESALTFFISDYARSELALDTGRSSSMVGFFWIGLLIGRLTVGLAPRAPSAGTTAILALLSSAVFAAFLSPFSLGPEFSLTLVGFFLGGVFPIMIGLAGLARPGATGSSVALAAGLGSIGGFVIPWLTGILATETSLRTALLTLSAWLLVLASASSIVYRRQTP
jgi:fucose permease